MKRTAIILGLNFILVWTLCMLIDLISIGVLNPVYNIKFAALSVLITLVIAAVRVLFKQQ